MTGSDSHSLMRRPSQMRLLQSTSKIVIGAMEKFFYR